MNEQLRSVITCDMEGRIETFNKGAETIFGYRPDEVIGKKRVSLFSPGQVVLEHVPKWLKEASEKGAFNTRTTFVRRDGSQFAAEVKITPTFKHGQQIGYCGVTVPLEGVKPEEVAPKISLATRIFSWLVITRAPFLTATLVPIAIGATWAGVVRGASPFPWTTFWAVLAGGLLLHLAANTYNDYFDWTSGTDQANAEYFLPFSGGSRSIELGLITEKGLFRLATTCLILAIAVGAYLLTVRGPTLLLFGLIGAFSAIFYTAPPLRLAARKGLGELFVGLNFGPLMVAGTSFALTGRLGWEDFLAGVPVGLLTTAILWINEFPDAPSDQATGKHHLVVVLGKERAIWGYVAIVIAAFALVVGAVASGTFPLGALVTLATLPTALFAIRHAIAHFDDRTLVKANAKTIQLQAVFGVLMAVGIGLTPRVLQMLGR